MMTITTKKSPFKFMFDHNMFQHSRAGMEIMRYSGNLAAEVKVKFLTRWEISIDGKSMMGKSLATGSS